MSHHRARAGLVAAALTGLAVLGVQAPASAAPGDDCPAGQHYAPGSGCVADGITSDDGDRTYSEGEAIDLTITGLLPFSFVDVVLHSDPIFLGRFQADAGGVAHVHVTLPDGVPAGQHHIEATGTGADGRPVSYSFAVRVVGAPSTGGSGGTTRPVTSGSALPRTGTEVEVLALAGLVLVGTGAGAVYAGRRRPVTV